MKQITIKTILNKLQDKHDIDEEVLSKIVTTGLSNILKIINKDDDFYATRKRGGSLEIKIFPERTYNHNIARKRHINKMVKKTKLEIDEYLYFGVNTKYEGQPVLLYISKTILKFTNNKYHYRTKIKLDFLKSHYYKWYYKPIKSYERCN